jgi:hypothetical protein
MHAILYMLPRLFVRKWKQAEENFLRYNKAADVRIT